MEFPFDIVPHTISAAHVREYPQAQVSEDEDLYLEIKQYIPKPRNSLSGGKGDAVTIIAAGGNGYVKELYEPLFADLLATTRHAGLEIRSIWMADPVNMGASAIRNRLNLGCDPHWWDHSRDLFVVVNHFHKEMVRPIIGLGHSMGGNQLVYLSCIHPRLFTSLALVEAGIDPLLGKGLEFSLLPAVLQKKDSWQQIDEAQSALLKSFQTTRWDPRVRMNLVQHGVYLDQDSPKKEWKLSVPKHQEAALYMRYNAEDAGLKEAGLESTTLEERIANPDVDPAAWNPRPLYNPAFKGAWDLLPKLRPWVLYINGDSSPFFGRPEAREERARITGTGVGGSGGMKLGTVEQVVIPRGRHTMVFDESIPKIAAHVAEWITREMKRWKGGEKRRREEWERLELREKQSVPQGMLAELERQAPVRRFKM